ncbi:hypothetical protein SAY87_009713 [Trapa incisa]|uniref:Uncharacterized protein n=1 Tax=Trapa incisa TaxID=236973 RepID=A0AAN7PY36_9MYRT|nr:hypothetical protein SAY87_009713 [Trapa incisa]
MGDPPKSPYAWRMPPLPSLQLPPPPSPLPKYNTLPMLYYGLLVVGTAAVVLAMYNLIVVRWCTDHWTSATSPPTRPRLVEVTGGDSQSFERPGLNMLSSFKYFKKDAVAENGELECAVCLSVVEDGEEIRQLPRWLRQLLRYPMVYRSLQTHPRIPGRD